MVRRTVWQKSPDGLAFSHKTDREEPDYFRICPVAIRRARSSGKNDAGRSGKAENRSRSRFRARFWAEKPDFKHEFEGKSKEFSHGNAKGGRSTSKAMDPQIKTCENSQESPNRTKSNLGLFLVEIFEISQNQRKIWVDWGRKQRQIRGNPCSDTI